jgi:hypothetical protein
MLQSYVPLYPDCAMSQLLLLFHAWATVRTHMRCPAQINTLLMATCLLAHRSTAVVLCGVLCAAAGTSLQCCCA